MSTNEPAKVQWALRSSVFMLAAIIAVLAATVWPARADGPLPGGRTAAVVGTQGSQVYHTRDCWHAERIQDSRRVRFASEAEAIAAGRRKCKVCVKIEEREGANHLGVPKVASLHGRSEEKDKASPGAVSHAVSAPASRPASVRIVEVLDGDTLKEESGGRVRLMGISCPEVDQRIGAAAKRFVEQRTLGRSVELIDDPVNARRNHQDQWRRRLAYVRLPEDGADLSRAIIAAGLGWYDYNNRATRKQEYLGVERAARKAQLGIWKPLPEPDGSRLVRVAPSGYSYHPPSCIHLRKTKQPQSMTVNEAKAAGYRPCVRYAGP